MVIKTPTSSLLEGWYQYVDAPLKNRAHRIRKLGQFNATNPFAETLCGQMWMLFRARKVPIPVKPEIQCRQCLRFEAR